MDNYATGRARDMRRELLGLVPPHTTSCDMLAYYPRPEEISSSKVDRSRIPRKGGHIGGGGRRRGVYRSRCLSFFLSFVSSPGTPFS